jgi:hypothetical protein
MNTETSTTQIANALRNLDCCVDTFMCHVVFLGKAVLQHLGFYTSK